MGAGHCYLIQIWREQRKCRFKHTEGLLRSIIAIMWILGFYLLLPTQFHKKLDAHTGTTQGLSSSSAPTRTVNTSLESDMQQFNGDAWLRSRLDRRSVILFKAVPSHWKWGCQWQVPVSRRPESKSSSSFCLNRDTSCLNFRHQHLFHLSSGQLKRESHL